MDKRRRKEDEDGQKEAQERGERSKDGDFQRRIDCRTMGAIYDFFSLVPSPPLPLCLGLVFFLPCLRVPVRSSVLFFISVLSFHSIALCLHGIEGNDMT